MGYDRAGFDVVGVDVKPQPRYPFEFHPGRRTRLGVVPQSTNAEFDAIHASPHRARRSRLARVIHGVAGEHPDLLGRRRESAA
jgi:DNA (cytosine-5)-methyltransferase 1